METPTPPSAVVVTLSEIDAGNANQLRSQLAPAVRRYVEADDASAAPLSIDLGAVTFLDSTGLAALLDADRAVRAVGGRLDLVNLQHPVRRVLELTGVWEHLQATGRVMDLPWHRGLR
jgi:anti-anti-sigma factor